MKKFQNSPVVLITGASGGIGEACAVAFHAAGARLAISGRKAEKLHALAARLPGSLVLTADLSDEGQSAALVSKVTDHFGRIDVLVNNAASIIISPVDQVSTADLMRAFSTNVCAPLLCIREAMKSMRQQDGGVIINIGSPGFMLGIPFYAPYVCSKAGFSALTRTLQAENEHPNIHICEYFPGYIKTPNKAESRIGDVPQDLLMADHPGRFTRPQEPETVARHIVKLAQKPRLLMHSSWKVRMGSFMALFPGFRYRLSRKMAENARKKMDPSTGSG